MSPRRFRAEVAIATGGAPGLGEAMARRLAAEGRHVIVADIDAPGADGVAAAIAAGGGSARALATDVTRPADVTAMVAAAEQAATFACSCSVPPSSDARPSPTRATRTGNASST
jgi:NAD(P)-dependent dehydrogenase (short-subunit alcohol dehydrogenase family)